MKQFKLSLVLLGVAASAPALLTTQSACARPANVAVHTPKPGSRERSAIMDALRIPLTKSHRGKRITFTRVDEFRVGGGWAHLNAATVDANNKPLGPDPSEPYMSLSALLHLEKGRWRVVEWIYAGDVIEIEWAHTHPDVPLNVLGLKPSDLR